MRAKKLEQLYHKYILNNDFSTLPEIVDSATIYGSDEFHINAKQKTLYIQGLGVISLEFQGNIEHINKIEWVAITQNGEDGKLSLGTGNPFQENAKELLPSWENLIIAIPHIVRKKFHS